MKTRITDITAFATQVWLLEPEAAQFLMAQAIAGTLALDLTETPLVYAYADCYGYFPSAQVADSTAILSVLGIITDDAASYIVNQLRTIFSDKLVSTLLVRINSPGGGANAAYKIADALRSAPIPTKAFIDYGQASSAAYLIAASCNQTQASRPNDMVGSIGTYGSYQNFRKQYENMGVVMKDIYATQSTEKNLEARQAEKGNFKPIEARMDTEADRFIAYVKDQRGDRLNYSDDTDPFKGRLFSAEDALSIGLIDAIGPIEDAIAALRSLVASPSTPANTMLGFIRMSALEAVKALPASDITEAHLTAINEQLAAQGFTNLLVVSAAQLDAANAQSAQIATLQTQLSTLTTTNQTLTATEANLKAEVARLGQQPGSTPTAPVQADSKVEVVATQTGPTIAEVLASLPHNQAVDANPAFAQAVAQQ